MDAESPSMRVVEAVAEREGEPPETLSPPLYEVIDPDALDELIGSRSSDLNVTFEYANYFVQVKGNGTVSVTTSETVDSEF